jgi:uncharacterized membrane protein (UPF0127 family)
MNNNLSKMLFTNSNGEEVVAFICSTAFLGYTGARHRQYLPPNDGILFDLGYYGDHQFWMDQVRIPLDIIFMDQHLKIIGIYREARPMDRAPISIGKSSMYVLEVNAGWCDKNNVTVGNTAIIKLS